MWQAGGGRLAVSIKSNPGARTHADCGARGYTDLAPALARSPALALGVRHVLAARIEGDVLVATADGDEVWRGGLPAAAAALVGPIGLRTDNVMLDAIQLTELR